MQQGTGQGSEARHPSSPRRTSGSGLPKFSLLGQQLTSYAQQNPPTSCNMGFSLGVHPQAQSHQSHPQAFAQAQTMNGSGNGGGGGERSYANFLQNMSNPSSVGGTFSHNNNQNSANFVNQLSAGQDLLNKNLANTNMQGSSPEAIMSALQIIQQKIGQLQAIVPLLASGTVQSGNQQAQQQVAAASTISMISQLAAVASSMFSGVAQAPQGPAALPSQQQSTSNNFTGPRSQLHEIIQHMGESLPPHAYNFFQQQGGSSGISGQQAVASMTNPAMGNSMGNNFPGMQASGGNDLAGPLPNMGPGLVGNLNGVFGCDGGSSIASPEQNFRNKELGSVLNSNQMGNGSARNTFGSAAVGRESNAVSRPPSHHSVVGSASQLEDDACRRRSGDDDDDGEGEGEKLDPSEYELIEMDAVEILAEHTHFCEICGKGFKRDANLRMHMRGHGDEYKTPAALARPDKAAHDQAAVKERRYSCPYAGCKRNKKHRKFAPLKTMLCVKNHYRRSHCPKILSCAKCKSKKFSVVADLKTHEKHCGCDKWQCSCGTTFSRKDKLLGHISLFAGHTPAVPLDNDNHRELDPLDLSASGQNLVQQQQPSVNDSSQYNVAGNSGMGAGMISGMSSGNGVGHVIPGMHGRLTEESNVGSEATSTNSYSQNGQGLLPTSSMLSGLFTSNFLQGSSGGSTSAHCLH